jgi:hypothetical protein
LLVGREGQRAKPARHNHNPGKTKASTNQTSILPTNSEALRKYHHHHHHHHTPAAVGHVTDKQRKAQCVAKTSPGQATNISQISQKGGLLSPNSAATCLKPVTSARFNHPANPQTRKFPEPSKLNTLLFFLLSFSVCTTIAWLRSGPDRLGPLSTFFDISRQARPPASPRPHLFIMVYCGPPSKGCSSCRDRKIRVSFCIVCLVMIYPFSTKSASFASSLLFSSPSRHRRWPWSRSLWTGL